MTAAVIGNHSVTPSFVRTRMYGANVREEADDGLFEAVKANRAYRKQVAAKREEAQSVQRAKAEQEAYDESVEGIDEQISKARRRRQWLKEELEKAELLEAALMKKKQKALDVKKKVKERENAKEALERKRKAAFARKLEESGGKPGGVTKSISPKKAPASMQRKYGG
jgi:predicted RNase H-like nuclease (RuvC/YqgF family)